MATSTRTTFTASPDGPIITVEQRVSQSVARRALRQIEAVKQQPNAPALAAPGGLVQRPGGEPLRPRATQATGATPVGAAVQYNQGILTGQALVGGETPYESLPVGWQVGQGDPTVVDVVARYAEDRYLDEATLTLYYWQQLTGQAAEWVAVGGGADILVLDAAPTVPPDSSTAVAFVREPKETYVWDALAATPAWLGPYGGGGGGGVSLSRTVCTFFIDSIPSAAFYSDAIFDALNIDELGIFTQGSTELGPLAPGQYLMSAFVNLPRRLTTNGHAAFAIARYVDGVKQGYNVSGDPYALTEPGPLNITHTYEANASSISGLIPSVLVTGHMTVPVTSTIRCQFWQRNGLGSTLASDSCTISVIKLS